MAAQRFGQFRASGAGRLTAAEQRLRVLMGLQPPSDLGAYRRALLALRERAVADEYDIPVSGGSGEGASPRP
jgi:hypothetical protein